MTTINKASGVEKIGVVCLTFLTYNNLQDGHAACHGEIFPLQKVVQCPPLPPPQQESFQKTLYFVFPSNKLRMKFYINMLQNLAMDGEIVYMFTMATNSYILQL